MNAITNIQIVAGAAVISMKPGAWKRNSITLASELAAISVARIRPGPPPAAARYNVIAEKITIENATPHTNKTPAVRRSFWLRASM